MPSTVSPPTGLRIGSATRIAWLALTHRLLGPGGFEAPSSHLNHRHPVPEEVAQQPSRRAAGHDVRTREGLLLGLSALGLRADPTRISRWETGRHQIPPQILDGYEQLLGLPRGQLVLTAAGLRRTLDPSPRAVRLFDPEAPRDPVELGQVLDRLEAGGHDGSDWVRLAAAVDLTRAGIRPAGLRRRIGALLPQLAAELFGADGLAGLRRSEAARSLIRHRSTGSSLLDALVELCQRPGAQDVEAPLALLAAADTPLATDLALDLLDRRADALRRGAARASALMVAAHRFDRVELALLADELLPNLLRSRPPAFAEDALDVLAVLPTPLAERTLAQLADHPMRAQLRGVLESGLMVPPGTADAAVGAVVRTTLDAAGNAGLDLDRLPGPDELLPQLVREGLFHVHRERRAQAHQLLWASVYGPHVAGAVLAVLDNLPPVAALELVRHLQPGEPERAPLLQLAFGHADELVRCRALRAAAHLTVPLSAEEETRVLRLALADPSPAVRTAATYLLGRTRSPHLATLATDADDAQSASADWWLKLGDTGHG